MKELLKTIISDFHQRGIDTFTPRNKDIPLHTEKIIALIGSRRAGKTYTLMELINKLINENIPLKNILYMNFEDERLNLKTKDLQTIYEAYLELYPDINSKEIYFFFDEIQEIEGWEKFVRRVHDTISKHIYLTGSSAKLLSKEIATNLRGRALPYEIYPLSFKEYLRFKNIEEINIYETITKAKLKEQFQEYLKHGGFPEIINFDEQLKIKTLQTYLDVMILRDLIERYNLANSEAIKLFIKKGIDSTGKEFSIHKTYNEMKSLGVKIGKESIYELAEQTQDIHLLFFLEKYESSIIKRQTQMKKVYVLDTGLITATNFSTSENRGRMLETVTYIELKRQEKNIFYHKEKKECDFIIQEKNTITQAIQVTQTLQDETTRKREIEGLLEALNKYNLQEGIILTEDEEEIIEQDKKKIKVKPLWKWLLE